MAKSGNNNERGQKLEGMYNTFMGDVSQLFPKTDSNLLLNVMALERKFPDMMPHDSLGDNLSTKVQMSNCQNMR